MTSQRSAARPFVVGLGGSTGSASTTNLLLTSLLARLDADTAAFGGEELGSLAIYGVAPATCSVGTQMLDAVRRADAVVIASPGYHGGMSGLVKNALDHLEELRDDARPYLEGRAVGVIVTAAGWQAVGTAVVSVRSTVHALRGWPTPFAVTVNTVDQRPDADGRFDDRVEGALDVLAGQVMQFVGWQRGRH